MKRILIKLASIFGPVKRLLRYKVLWWPGHYYSPIPDHNTGLKTTGDQEGRSLPIHAIELNDSKQLKLLSLLIPLMKESSFRNEQKTNAHRFYNDNGIYQNSDSLFLEAMIRYLQPGRIIEIGSGFSSALMVDVNDKYFNGSINLSMIEPYPERLFSLITESDKQKIELYIKGVQTVDLAVFMALKENDILFVDSTHVAKTGSDLLYLFFEILPILNKGVYIHFHDIFNNFEYLPYHFNSFDGFGWNECYFLRAFLMYNPHFEIVLFSNYLDNKYPKEMLQQMSDYPLLKGGQIWLRKL